MDALGTLEVRWVQGFTRGTFTFVEKETVCYSCGNFIVFFNVKTKARRTLQSPGSGIGTFGASGHRRCLAFSDLKLKPSIFVYKYPELELVNELKGTSELGYTALSLCDTGPYLVCASYKPDHTITLWNWESGFPLCSQSLFEEDVTALVFNPMNWCQIGVVKSKSLAILNIERCDNYHMMKLSTVELPTTEGLKMERESIPSHVNNGKLTYLGPQMPISAIAGLTGDRADFFVPLSQIKARLCPSAICWSTSSDLYVGCKEGFLICVNPETFHASVLFNPTTDTTVAGEDLTLMQEGSFRSIALQDCNLFAGGKEGILRNIQIKGNKLEVLCTWVLDENISNICLSPNGDVLLLISNTGHVYRFNPSLKEKPVKVLDVLCGDLVAVAPLLMDNSICLSIREAGDLQLWALDDGLCVGSISLQTHVTSMACCLVAQYVVIGTVTGHLLFVELTTIQKPRLVHKVQLYHVSIDHLVRQQVDAETDLLRSDSAGCMDAHGCLSKDVFHSSLYELPHALSSCVLATNKILGYCQQRNALQSFIIPESAENPLISAQEAVPLILENETRCHVLGPAFLQLSPHQTWLGTIGRDGLLRICETSNMESSAQLQCHSCWQGGAGSFCFTTDCQSLITAGLRDGALVCTRLRLRISGAGKAKAATRFSQLLADSFESLFSAENTFLTKMPEWDSQAHTRCSSFLAGEVSLKGKMSHEAEEEENCFGSPSSQTWLERKLDVVLQEEAQRYTESKKNLRRDIMVLRDSIKGLMEENERLTDIEKLEQQEFNLDLEEQQRLQLEGEQEVNRVRKEIEMENLAKRYQREVLKRECWDSMQVKGKAIKAFHSENEVRNYPMKERTKQETEELRRVESMRQIEQTDSQLQEQDVDTEYGNKKEEMTASPALTGSLSALYGGINLYLYDQFKLHIREQKINQITLLKDVIYRVKTAFNKEFEAIYKQKVQEINRIREKNKRVYQIMAELDLSETLWEPGLTDNECPERALTVSDSEIKVEKYLTPEQKAKEQKLREEEERHRLAAKSVNTRDQALSVMMGGVLEVKKEDVLKMEVPQPEFLSKPEAQWTEDERKSFKEYEKRAKELSEEKEKYRKTLETEMKKLQISIKEATQMFDDKLAKLFERKVKSGMAIYQEELKIANLVHSLQTEEEILTREKQLSFKLEKARFLRSELGDDLKKHKEIVDVFREVYENTVAEDKLLDKGFRKEFYDVHANIIDQLYKLYKRRPRVQRIKTQTENNQFKDGSTNGLSQMLKAMEELDAPENMPEGLDSDVWERFCLARRTKVESEQGVKLKALKLAEMQAFLVKRIEEEEKAELEIKTLIDEMNGLSDLKLKFRLDSMVQIVLQQGQVEVEAEEFIADYSNALLINRKVVEDLNSTIKALGEQKIGIMVECKDFRKGIIKQEWEHRRMCMQLEDLRNKARSTQTLRITQDIQEYLNETNNDNRVSKQLVAMDKTIVLQKTTYEKKIENCKKQIKNLDRQVAHMQEKNQALDAKLAQMEVEVAERRIIFEAVALSENQEAEYEKNYQYIIQRKKLLNIGRAQSEEILVLRAELEKLRMKNFPSLGEIYPN
ncbi:hypothetical protein DNTS_034432 [Danionella cerebrum]|uniref:Cilia- and flagella-associated protein 43 n=1 Tax=Danionella cerebrum TaxID=2873325 RepID=A0A553MQG4_9TELE|nr:hypothetical protein DNTS_034432 [Danionella translucida]TRY55423.1 hypothetical protein DNTS_034432 [Danionella translucida]TRY55424.1 hypothetical protein DNTS_034432 [Danionella translucida]